MTIIARFPVELNGHIYRKGEKCSYTGTVTERIAYNFTADDGSQLLSSVANDGASSVCSVIQVDDDEAKIRRCAEAMGRDGIMRALDGMNITYSNKSKTEYLAKLLLCNRGEITE